MRIDAKRIVLSAVLITALMVLWGGAGTAGPGADAGRFRTVTFYVA